MNRLDILGDWFVDPIRDYINKKDLRKTEKYKILRLNVKSQQKANSEKSNKRKVK